MADQSKVAADAFEEIYLAELAEAAKNWTAADIENLLAGLHAAEHDPKVQLARAEVQRRVQEIRDAWESEYGAKYPSDRLDLKRLAARAGVPAELILAGMGDRETHWNIWVLIEGWLLRAQDLKNWTPPAPLRSIRLSDAEKDIIGVIRDTGQRLSRKGVFDALSKIGKLPSVGTTNTTLAAMVRHGILTHEKDSNPSGYGLPEWS